MSARIDFLSASRCSCRRFASYRHRKVYIVLRFLYDYSYIITEIKFLHRIEIERIVLHTSNKYIRIFGRVTRVNDWTSIDHKTIIGFTPFLLSQIGCFVSSLSLLFIIVHTCYVPLCFISLILKKRYR